MPSRPFLKALRCGFAALTAAIAGATPPREEKPAAKRLAPVVWTLDSTTVVGGHKPEPVGSPQVVEEDGRKAVYFDGQRDGLFFSVNPLAGWPRFTVQALIKPDPTGGAEQRFVHIQDVQGRRAMLETRMTPDRRWVLDTYLRASAERSRTLIDRSKTHPSGQWHWVALVYDGEIMTNYIEGVKELEGEVLLPPMVEGAISVGVRQNKVSWYKGAIREIRFHPEALEPAALQRVRR